MRSGFLSSVGFSVMSCSVSGGSDSLLLLPPSRSTVEEGGTCAGELEHVDDDGACATELKDGLDGALSGVARFFAARFPAAVSIALRFRS